MPDIMQAAARLGRVRMLYIETPANPTNALVDIEACTAVARQVDDDGRRPIVAVDDTFLGPLWQHPLRHGADLVLYSLTKYVAGHSDVIAGACLGSEGLISAVRGMRTILGTMADPWSGWLIMRSLETVKLRMTSQKKSAHQVADFLAEHPKVRKVLHLGFLEDDEAQRDIYRRHCEAPGSTGPRR